MPCSEAELRAVESRPRPCLQARMSAEEVREPLCSFIGFRGGPARYPDRMIGMRPRVQHREQCARGDHDPREPGDARRAGGGVPSPAAARLGRDRRPDVARPARLPDGLPVPLGVHRGAGSHGDRAGSGEQPRHGGRRAGRTVHRLAHRSPRAANLLPRGHRVPGRLVPHVCAGGQLAGHDRGDGGLLVRLLHQRAQLRDDLRQLPWRTGTGRPR